jgi:hypothetical protein
MPRLKAPIYNTSGTFSYAQFIKVVAKKIDPVRTGQVVELVPIQVAEHHPFG